MATSGGVFGTAEYPPSYSAPPSDAEIDIGLQAEGGPESMSAVLAAYPGLDAAANLASYPGITAYLSADPGISAYPGMPPRVVGEEVVGDLDEELEIHSEYPVAENVARGSVDDLAGEIAGHESGSGESVPGVELENTAAVEEADIEPVEPTEPAEVMETAEVTETAEVAVADAAEASDDGQAESAEENEPAEAIALRELERAGNEETGPSVEDQAEAELEAERRGYPHRQHPLSEQEADEVIASVSPANAAAAHAAAENVPGMAQMQDALFAAQTKLAAAEARLSRSEEQAQAIINDALEQSALILERSQQHADDVISHARMDEERIIARGHEEASATRERALQVLRDTDSLAEQLRGEAEAEIRRYREEALHAIDDERDVKAVEAQRTIAEMQRQIEGRRGEVDIEIKSLLSSAKQERANAVIDADMVKSRARLEAEQILEAARRAAEKEMAAASAQTEWAARTVADLMATAEHEAAAVKARTHRSSLESVAKLRGRLGELIAAANEAAQRREADALEKADLILYQARLDSDEKMRLAADALDRATVEAEGLREEAHLTTRKLLADAQDTAEADREQAYRRLAQAEEGAKAVRQRVAEDLAKAQWELHEVRQAAKAERDAIIGSATTEAEEIRSRAREAAERARTELAELTQRRNTIARELASLSGVIDALAVPEGVSVGPKAIQQEVTAQQ